MAKTNADYQREQRERRADRLAELESALADRDADLAASRARIERLERELDRVYAMLETASAEPEAAVPGITRPAGPGSQTPDCPHPAAAVDGGTCRACGAEVW
jgi:Tfp pilus assembly protein FimV